MLNLIFFGIANNIFLRKKYTLITISVHLVRVRVSHIFFYNFFAGSALKELRHDILSCFFGR